MRWGTCYSWQQPSCVGALPATAMLQSKSIQSMQLKISLLILLLPRLSAAPMYPPLASHRYSGTGLARDPCARGLQSLYPFGIPAGDTVMQMNDDGSSGALFFPPGRSLRFFGQSFTSVFINTNGVISTSSNVSLYTPEPFPIRNGQAWIAPFWSDVDTVSVCPACRDAPFLFGPSLFLSC